MSDLTEVIQPKADQLTADDLIAGPKTIVITQVSVVKTPEQPVAISFEGDLGKPWKPCKTMCRVLVQMWGADSSKFIGRSVTLYRDASVKWGGLEVGGIRISHMTHINGSQTMALTVTRGSKKPFTVRPLVIKQEPAPAPKTPAPATGRTFAEFLAEVTTQLAACTAEEQVHAIVQRADVQKAIGMKNNASDKVNALIKGALERVAMPAEEEASQEEDWGAEFDAAAA
jgi:hypothetical protein